MLQGSVALYTNRDGLSIYLSTGSCEAEIERDGIYNYQIIVPIQAVTYDLELEFEHRIKKNVFVNLGKIIE